MIDLPNPSFKVSSSIQLLQMHLIQDLVDHTIDFLHDDPKSLIRVSLVSKAWAGRTRPHLFRTMKITRANLSSSDPSYLAPLCRYVGILNFQWPKDTTNPSTALDCFEQSERLHTLAIYPCELHRLNEQTILRRFAKFPCASTVTLQLRHVTSTPRTFLAFLLLFPNVDNLTIHASGSWTDVPGPPVVEGGGDQVHQPVSPPCLRGSFKFHHDIWGFREIQPLPTLAALPLQFQTVSLNVVGLYWLDVLTFLDACSKTVRKVFVESPSRKFQPFIPMRARSYTDSTCKCVAEGPIDRPPIKFVNLEELRLRRWDSHNCTRCDAHPLIQSAASPCLQRVVLEVEGIALWCPRLDGVLVDLVESQKAHGGLVVQVSTIANPQHIRGWLPRLSQIGALEVRRSERPDYCVDIDH